LESRPHLDKDLDFVFIELEEQPIQYGAQIAYTVGFQINDLVPQIE